MLPKDEQPTAPPSLHDEAAGAYALAEYARSSFAQTAHDLEDAADQQDAIATKAQASIDELTELRDDALAHAQANRSAAGNIRELLVS